MIGPVFLSNKRVIYDRLSNMIYIDGLFTQYKPDCTSVRVCTHCSHNQPLHNSLIIGKLSDLI